MAELPEAKVTIGLSIPPKVAAGLLVAQRFARAVPKDAKNEHHRYRYAKSESVIEEGRYALNEGELALLQAGVVVHLLERGEQEDRQDDDREKSRLRATIRARYVLVHASGEAYQFERDWPCVVQKGRPLDKAEGGALTTALAYTYRDLLGLPRDDELADMNRRDDRDEEPRKEEPRREEPRKESAPDSRPAPEPANDRGPSREAEHPFLRLLPLIQSRSMKPDLLASEIDKSDLTKDERTALDFVVQAFAAKETATIIKLGAAIRKSELSERLRNWTLTAFKPAYEALTAEPAKAAS